MAEKEKKEEIEEATKPVAPIDLSALKNLEVASERDESLKGIKRASISISGKKVNIVVASGLKNARTIMEEIKSGKHQQSGAL